MIEKIRRLDGTMKIKSDLPAAPENTTPAPKLNNCSCHHCRCYSLATVLEMRQRCKHSGVKP